MHVSSDWVRAMANGISYYTFSQSVVLTYPLSRALSLSQPRHLIFENGMWKTSHLLISIFVVTKQYSDTIYCCVYCVKYDSSILPCLAYALDIFSVQCILSKYFVNLHSGTAHRTHTYTHIELYRSMHIETYKLHYTFPTYSKYKHICITAKNNANEWVLLCALKIMKRTTTTATKNMNMITIISFNLKIMNSVYNFNSGSLSYRIEITE